MGRLPPHEDTAEMAALGACMLDSGDVVISSGLRPNDFFPEKHQMIFAAMLAIAERNEPVDIVTLKDELNRRGQLDIVGGPPYLLQLGDTSFTIEHLPHYARIVKDNATRRRIIDACNDIAGMAYIGAKNPSEIAFFASIRLAECNQSGPVTTNDSATPWPAPLAPAALIGFIGDMVRSIAPHTESDPAALVFQFLAAFGNLIGHKAFFQVEADKHYTNLFVCIIGRSSKGRKGTSYGYILRLLKEVDHFWSEDRVRAGLSSGEGLIFSLRDDGDSDDKRLLAVESEFATLLRVVEREGNTVSARIRDAWDGKTLYSLTKHSPLKATGAHISIIGHCTADELRRYLTRTELGNGFANRILWVCAQRSKLLPEGGNLTDGDLNLLIEKLRDVVEFTNTVQQVTRDDEARELWRQVYPILSGETPGLLGSVISRAEAQVTRLSMLYAVLDKSNVIRREHLQAALALWKYAEASARFVFGDSTGDAVADSLLTLLKSSPDGIDTASIHRHFHNNLPARRLDSALDMLMTSGKVKRVSRPTNSGKGRPAYIWQVVHSDILTGMPNNESNERISDANNADTNTGGISSLNSSPESNDVTRFRTKESETSNQGGDEPEEI